MTVTPKKLAANRANAKKSTGPRTAEGKARSSMNALKHGFFSARLVLPHETAPEFIQSRDRMLRKLKPADLAETMLCEEMIDLAWRLARLQREFRPTDPITAKRYLRYEQRLMSAFSRATEDFVKRRSRSQQHKHGAISQDQSGPDDAPSRPCEVSGETRRVGRDDPNSAGTISRA